MINIAKHAAELGMSVEEFEEMHEHFAREQEREEEAELAAIAAATPPPKQLSLPMPIAAPTRPAEAVSPRKAAPLAFKRKLLADGSLGRILPIGENLMAILANAPEWQGVLAHNELDGSDIKIKPPPFNLGAHCGQWTDNDTFLTQCAISSRYNVEFPRAEIDAAIQTVASQHRYHPVRIALEKLVWDGEERLTTWLQVYLGAKNTQYMRAIGPKILIGAVARIFQPGCKLDTMPILEGAQGLRKSTVWKILAGKEEWFSDTAINIGDKDSYQSLRGAWIIEFGEMAAVLKRGGARLETAKAYLTASCDRYRPSYGRRVQTYERQCIFVGTTNEHDYLKDPTGNRRFWPIACGTIDIEALREDRDQLMAEAVAAYKKGVSWHLSEDEAAIAHAEQAQRNEEDPWESSVIEWIRREPEFVTTAGLLNDAIGVPQDRCKPQDQQRIGGILRRAGWAPRGAYRPVRWFNAKAKAKEKEKVPV